MAVDQVVAVPLFPPKAVQSVEEAGDVGKQIVLGSVEGAGLQVYDPGALFDLHDLRVGRVVAPGEDIDPVPSSGVLSG